MIEFQQYFLVILISTLTVLVVIFSIFVFRILQEMRDTFHKMNKILDDMGAISGSIAQPISHLSGMLEGFKGGFKIFEIIGNLASRHQTKPVEVEEEEEADD